MSDSNERSQIKLHFFYVTLILCLFLILLVTINWTPLRGFTQYLNIAATVTSLVLGLLAIIYAFVSSGTISQSLGSIEKSSRDVTDVASDLREVLTGGQSLQARAEERTEKLHELISELRSGINSLAETTGRIAGSVDAIPDKISSMQKMGASTPPNVPMLDDDGMWDADEVEHFVAKCSAYGLLILYASLRAVRAGRFINLKKLLGEGNYEYAWGFMVASNAAGIIQLEYAGKKRSMQAVRVSVANESVEIALDAAWIDSSNETAKRRQKLFSRYEAEIEAAFVDAEAEEGAAQ